MVENVLIPIIAGILAIIAFVSAIFVHPRRGGGGAPPPDEPESQ